MQVTPATRAARHERRAFDVEALDVKTKVVRGATSLYIANVVATLFNTAYFVLLTNVLAPQEVGLVSLLNIIVIAIGTVAILGSPMVGAGLSSPPAVARFLAQYTTKGSGRAARKIVLTSLLLCAAISVGLASLLCYPPVARSLSYPLGSEAVFYAALDAVLFSLGQLSVFAVVGVGRTGRAGLLIGVSVLVKYSVASFLLFSGLGAPGVFIGFSFGDFALLAGTLPVAVGSALRGGDSRVESRPIFGYMSSVLPSSLVGLAVNQTGKLLAFFHGSFSDLAVFNVAAVSASVVAQGPTALTNAMVPTLAGLGEGSPASRREVVSSLARYVSLVAFPVGFWFAAVSPLLPSLLGNGYAAAPPLIAIMSASVSLSAVMSVYSSELLVGRRTFLFLMGNVLGLVALLVASYALTPLLGLIGIAVGRAVMLFVSLLAFGMFLRTSRELVVEYSYYLRALAGSTVMMAAIIATSLLVAPHARLESAAVILATVPLAALVYLVSLRFLGAFKEQDFQLLERLLPRPISRLAILARKLLV
jgi:O-antigen/teichoic acid export membrane protein